MKQCMKCGTQNPDSAQFCQSCGQPLPNVQNSWNPAPQPKQSNNTALYVIIGVLAALLLAGGGYLWMQSNKEKAEKEQAQLQELKNQTEALQKQNEQLAQQTAAAQQTANTAQQTATTAQQTASQNVVSGRVSSAKRYVVVNGVGVRFRFEPTLNAGYLVQKNGTTFSVKKGTKLTYTGEEGNWYQVLYKGGTYYLSKDFCYVIEE